ncbi:MAG: sigma-54-dependent Fis family transcriptional regulator [Deltaproteobacteria bacterium]|nr:sigma-54-dependent Fis family transcriptional regulator [Deltaproteobacteria bacterium]
MRVLVVDDEKNIRTTLAMCLETMGCQVRAVATAEAAIVEVERGAFDIAFVDLRLGAASGLDLLQRLLALRGDLAAVMITAYATVDTAVEALQRGAVDYLPKPFTPAQIRHLVEQIQSRRLLSRRVGELEELVAAEVPEVDLQPASPRMKATLETLARAAAAQTPILLRGENGTGKGVLARLVHAQSPRRGGPFVTVNCPTLSEELLASELFGHVRGAFTGAVRDQPGRVEAAEGGTLFLDEIGEISPGLQAKLLRFIQERQFERVGETRTRRADVRILAATNRDLEADVKAGRFREDLLFRLNVIEVTVPPLRDRPEDILRLARGFLAFFSRAANRLAPELTSAAEEALLAHRWPGNVRELRNAMERAVILMPSRVIGPEIVRGHPSPPPSGPSLGGDVSLEELEREHIERVIERVPTLEEAARVLGIDSSTLWRKRRKFEGGAD